MPSDPVRSIRVANVLAERFGVLLRTSSANTSDLELAIGEANQVYPEMWRHLDEAAAALAQRGHDTSMFEYLRREELGQLGVTDITAEKRLDIAALFEGELRTTRVKAATFNAAGYQRAKQAVKALKDAMPEVDWSALAREEEREIAAAGSLQTRKWLGIVKSATLAAAVIVAAVIIFRLVTSVEEEPSRPTRPRPDPEAETAALRERVETRGREIGALRRTYESTCSQQVKRELVKRLRDDSQLTAANKLEAAPCVPVRPACGDAKQTITERLAPQLELDRDVVVSCIGMVVAAADGFTPHFAIAITGGRRDGTQRTFRGVVSVDDLRATVPLIATDATPRLAGVADLDLDGADEVVFVGERDLIVARVSGNAFVDISGPKLEKGCAADVNVEGDYRDGAKGEHKLVVLTVPDGVPKRCLAPGRHYFALAGSELVAD